MVATAFAALDSPADITFTYMPLNHIDPVNYTYTCSTPENDCESTRFDSCLVHQFCWPNCRGAAAKALTSFLQCYEGPFANTETLTDPKRRLPCFAQAGYTTSDYNHVMTCATTPTQYLPIEAIINVSRAPMYEAIQPNPGYFPHIFLNGHHQFNDSWTFMYRTLCDELKVRDPTTTICPMQNNVNFTFDVSGVNVSIDQIQTNKVAFQTAINLGINLGTSEVAFPIHWKTATLPSDPPSYVNVLASASAVFVNAKEARNAVEVTMRMEEVLSEYVDEMTIGCNDVRGNVSTYIESALTATELFGKVNVSKTHVQI